MKEAIVEKVRLVVNHPVGLHARPAAKFVQTASRFRSEITVTNLTHQKNPVNAKSILMILTLGVNQGCEIDISAEGEDAAQAIDALKELVETNFGE
jgi:phosphotransferase system HPr (HPr) family protein